MDALAWSVAGHVAGVALAAGIAWVGKRWKIRAEQQERFVGALARAIERRKHIAKAINDVGEAESLRHLTATVLQELFEQGGSADVSRFARHLEQSGLNREDVLRTIRPVEGRTHG